MKSILLLVSLLFSLSSFSGTSIISLETQEIFSNLGYDNSDTVMLKSGDFGEGGGGNRPIKEINASGESQESIVYYYPVSYRLSFNQLSDQLKKKVPLHTVRVFNIMGQGKILSLAMDDIFSFDLTFEELIDLNNMSLKNISSIITMDGELYFPTDIVSIEIEAIIEP